MGGHLATATSAKEMDFIVDSGYRGALGGYQDLGASDYSEPDGGWRWVTGEPWDYTEWLILEPSNTGGTEHFLFTCCSNHYSGWNDGNGVVCGFIVEWSADCNNDGEVDYGQIVTGTLQDIDNDGVPDVCIECPADLDGNGDLNFFDISGFLAYYQHGDLNADFTEDGLINFFDVSAFLTAFNAGCP